MGEQRIVRPLKDRLAEALTMRDMKAIDLSKSTDISRGAISQYLAGKVKPKQDKIAKMANALRVSPAWLMGYNTDINKEDFPPDPEDEKRSNALRPSRAQHESFNAERRARLRTRVPVDLSLDERDFLEDFRALPPSTRKMIAGLVASIVYPEMQAAPFYIGGRFTKVELKELAARRKGELIDEPDDFDPSAEDDDYSIDE